jgi:hypothetical protein
MIKVNGHDGNSGAKLNPDPATVAQTPINKATSLSPEESQTAELATRTKQRARPQMQQNRFVIIAAGALVVALLIFVATTMPHHAVIDKTNKIRTTNAQPDATQGSNLGQEKSLYPITDSGRPAAQESSNGFLNEKDLQKTASKPPAARTLHAPETSAPGTLGSIAPFGGQPWQAPPYQPGTVGSSLAETTGTAKTEREAMEKPSMVYVRNVSASHESSQNQQAFSQPQSIGLGLSVGTRLRARLESAASTAVRTPVLAVIEYNYERDGEILIPAGTRATGHLQQADRSGYVRIQFDSLLMPDDSVVPIQAVATDLELRPLKGKVAGKNAGKNVLVRSLSGIGEMGAMLLGRGNLSQPLSESDQLRERLGNNIGEASDEELSRLTITQNIVVSIAADTAIYLVFEQAPKSAVGSGPSGLHGTQPVNAVNVDELRQLLQLHRELNQRGQPSSN